MGRERHNLRPLRARRRALRANMTPAERRLWTHLRRRQLDGWRWRRQYSVGAYVLDFFCPAVRLAVELDGAVHADPTRRGYDGVRERWLWEAEGIRVVRFENGEVMGRVEIVVEAIRQSLAAPLPTSPRWGEETGF